MDAVSRECDRVILTEEAEEKDGNCEDRDQGGHPDAGGANHGDDVRRGEAIGIDGVNEDQYPHAPRPLQERP